jgi:hypothetical protein
MTSTRRGGLAVSLSAALLALSLPLRATDKQNVGTMQLTIGWGDESAFAGSRNSIDIGVADGTGSPVADPTNTLNVEVSFGERRLRLPLLRWNVTRACTAPGSCRVAPAVMRFTSVAG